MKSALNKLIKNEGGQALIIVLVLLAIGSFTTVPLLSYMSTGIKSGQVYEQKAELSYAADAGIEDALWRTNNEEIPLDAYDYATEYIYSLPQNINGKAVTVTVKQVWPLADLESDMYGTTPASSLTITGGVVDEETGEYKAQISYDGAQGDLPIDRVAVWLPSGFDYVTGTSDGITTDDPTETAWHGGKTLLWNFAPAVNFLDLPIPEPEDPPPGGFTPAVEYPAARVLTFNVSPAGTTAGSYSWVRTTNTDLYLSWENGCTIYKAISEATDETTGKSVSIESYTYVGEGGGEGLLGEGGSLITGNYRAIGNTMMEDLNDDRTRETFHCESSSTVSDIPADAEVGFAYLYWSAWRDYDGSEEADSNVGLQINGQSVYFNEQGEAVIGELESDPETEILRPNGYGSYDQLSTSGGYWNYQCVDETVADDASSYVYATSGQVRTDTYNIQELSSCGTINSVTVNARARAYYSGSCANMRMQIVIRTHSTLYYGNIITLIGNAGWGNYSAIWATNPYTSAAWTADEIHNLQIGVKLYDDGTGTPQCTQVYTEVNYQPIFQGVTASKWWLLDNYPPDYAYSCFRDVTELVKLISTSGNGTFTVSGINGDTGSELSYAAWSLIIIYASPSEEVHQFFLYDSFLYATSNSSHTFTIQGFTAPAQAQAALTCFVGEGDDHYADDYLKFNDYSLSDAINPADNVWNGHSSSLGGETIDGVDIDTFNVSNPIIGEGDTYAEVKLGTGTDAWNLIYTVLAFRSEFGGLAPNSSGIISYGYSGGS